MEQKTSLDRQRSVNVFGAILIGLLVAIAIVANTSVVNPSSLAATQLEIGGSPPLSALSQPSATPISAPSSEADPTAGLERITDTINVGDILPLGDPRDAVQYVSINGIRVLIVNLRHPQIRVRALQANDSGGTETVQSMATRWGAIAAINGDYFSYFDQVGTEWPEGMMYIDGNDFTRCRLDFDCAHWRRSIAFSSSNWPSIGRDRTGRDLYNVVAGGPQFMFGGQFQWDLRVDGSPCQQVVINDEVFGCSAAEWNGPKVLSSVGYSDDGNTLYLAASEGNKTMQEMHDVLWQQGARHALRLDGGGSRTLYYNGYGGAWTLGGGRAVANAIAILPVSGPPPPPPPGDGIELCDGTNYGDPCQVFTEGRYSDLGTYGWADRAESVRFRGDYVGNYHVVLNTERDFEGNPYHADNDVPDLGDAHRNHIRSLYIYRHEPPPPCQDPNANQAALYADTNYGGSCVTLDIGEYPNPGHLGSLGNDNAESVKVGSNVQAILCEHDNYSQCETFTSDDPNLWNNSIGGNQVSSVKVEARGCQDVAAVGAGSSRQQLFVDAYNRNGGRDNLGCTENSAHWWDSGSNAVVTQDFTGQGGFGDCSIIHDEQRDNPMSSVPAFVVHSAIWVTYAGMGGPHSWLGPPTSDEFNNGSNAQNNFRSGYITWSGSDWQSYHWPSSFPEWKAEYFNLVNPPVIAGYPAFIRNESSVDHDWGQSAPDNGSIGVWDDFAVRWTRDVNFSFGRYRFHTYTDDGVRLWVGNTLVIDDWNLHEATERTGDIDLNGTYTVKMEYYDSIYDAVAKLWWEQLALSDIVILCEHADGSGVCHDYNSDAPILQRYDYSWAYVADGHTATLFDVAPYSGRSYTLSAGTYDLHTFGWGDRAVSLCIDECPCPLFADLDGDGDVDVTDIQQVASLWRCKCEDTCYDSRYDLDGDCDIDVVDIMMVVAHWGETCEPTAPDNLLVNPSFENGPYDPANNPEGWTTDAWGDSSTFTWDDSERVLGGKSVKIASMSPDDARWIQTVAVEPNTYYVLSGWIRTDNVAVSPPDQLADIGANLSIYGTWEHSVDLRGTNDWTYVSFEFDSGDNSEVTIACRLGYWSSTATGTAWFDDISLKETMSAQ